MMSKSVWEQLVNEIQAFTANIRDLPVQVSVRPEELRASLQSRYSFESPLPLETVAGDVSTLLRQWTVHVTHPRYFGLFNPSVRQAGILADALAALYNPQLAVWSHAPAANEIEQHTLNCFSTALGISGEESFANFTSGGSEANLSAVLMAIAHHFPGSNEHGVAGIGVRPAIYVTGETHHSFVKISRMSGLGTKSLRTVSTTSDFKMDTSALSHKIERDIQNGWYPLMIVGTSGTTSAGTVDPLIELADIAAKHGAWYHVDGAWGASAVLSSRLRAELVGIERADSVTWDAHKWLSVPMGAGMFFCRHREAIFRAFGVSTSYMPGKTDSNTFDQYSVGVQWSRRAIGLKVFMALAEVGLEGYGEIIEHQADMGGLLRERLIQEGWLIVNKTRLPVVCFTHSDIRARHYTTKDILKVIYERSRVWISDVVLGENECVLRACITSFRTNEDDIDCLIGELEYARQQCQTTKTATGKK